MKKTYLFHILFLAIIAVVGFSSCDEESIEPVLLNEELVGQSIVRLNYQDTLVIRRDVVATIDEKGIFSFTIKGKDKDLVHLQTLRFENGIFPANINRASYYFGEHNRIGFSVDANRPEYNTGYVRINNINTVGMAVDGEFKIKIYPPPMIPDANNNVVIINAFELHGEFRNLRYTKVVGDYFETTIGDRAWVYQNRIITEDVSTGRVTITTTNTVTEEAMEFTFDKDLDEGNYSLNKFSAKYTSTAGVVYETSESIGGSTLTIIENNNNRVKATFQLKMKNVAGNQTLDFTGGSFNLAY